MKKETKVKQIVIRFDNYSYDIIKESAEIEHRGLGEFVRHAALDYIEKNYQSKIDSTKGEEQVWKEKLE